MTVHEMRLHPTPFQMIKSGSKTVEMRLNDEKRQYMRTGDVIEFASRENPEDKLQAKIVGLDTFASFRDAYAAYPPEAYGGKSADEYEHMYKYYSREEEEKYGVVAVKLSVLSK